MFAEHLFSLLFITAGLAGGLGSLISTIAFVTVSNRRQREFIDARIKALGITIEFIERRFADHEGRISEAEMKARR